jgi:hypothetical protein
MSTFARLRSKRGFGPLASALALATAAGAVAFTCDGGTGTDAVAYEVSVDFTESSTQRDIDTTSSLLQSYDPDTSYLLQETFPPIGRATLRTSVAGFCETVVRQLEAVAGVGTTSCQLATTPAAGTRGAPAHSP